MTVTPLYAGVLAILFFVLSIRVIKMRGTGISLGDGGNPVMLRRIRGHANFAEYVPLILLMMGFLEINHYPSYLLHGIGVVLLVGRLLHGYALSFTEKFSLGRFLGTVLTFTALNVSALACVYQGLQAFARQA
jgi:uncharacterized membrane protein YecN with MAPEG domain